MPHARPATGPRTAPRRDPPERARRRWPWRLARLALLAGIWGALALTVLVLWFARDLPRPEDALTPTRRPGLVLTDRTGRTIASYGDVVGERLRLSDMPAWLPAAAVAVEDRRFWSHGALDPQGLLRALVVDVVHARVVQGGSTITQQVAKTLFLSNARTLGRKVQELLLTLWLARHFTRAEILEIWLNRVYLGSGSWGVDAAARLYFGVSARHVSLWQAAMLAGLPRAPSRFNPRTDPDAALARTREVLAAMADTGAITPAQAQTAGAAAADQLGATHGGRGWFADWAAVEAQHLVPEGVDATLRTTLDPRLQAAAEARLAALLEGPGAAAGATQGAVVVMDAATGSVRAMVGGRDYAQGPFNRAVLARRQPGSAFKPFVWLAALEHGAHPQDTVLDGPLRIGTWSPTDDEPGWHGEVTLADALALSLNTPAIRLLQRAGGPGVVAGVAHRLGIADRLPDTPSLALGTGEVGLLELVAAYAPLFNGGMLAPPLAVEGGMVDGRPLHGMDPAPPRGANPAPPRGADPAPPRGADPAPLRGGHEPSRRVVAAADAQAMAGMLEGVVTHGTARAAALPGHMVAGKTGTTQDSRDAWFVGDVTGPGTAAGGGTLIGVWLGRDDDRPMRGVMGGGLPARLFHDIGLALR